MDARRKKLIAQAHLAAKKLGLDEAARRAAQAKVTGKESCAEMSERELVMLIDHWGRAGADVRAALPEGGDAPGMATRWQLATIERLAWEMGWDDGLKDGRLLRFVRRTAKVDRPEWLTKTQCSSAISGLRRWQAQLERKRT